LPYLRPAVALVLGFIGLKMGLEFFSASVPTAVSLAAYAWLLGAGVGLSLIARAPPDALTDTDMVDTEAAAAAPSSPPMASPEASPAGVAVV